MRRVDGYLRAAGFFQVEVVGPGVFYQEHRRQALQRLQIGLRQGGGDSMRGTGHRRKRAAVAVVAAAASGTEEDQAKRAKID
jgi:hypothetical protein